MLLRCAEKGQFGTETCGYTLHGNSKNQYQPFSQGFFVRPLTSYLLGRQCCIPNSTLWNLGARSSQRILGSRSEHATLVVRLCAHCWSPHGVVG